MRPYTLFAVLAALAVTACDSDTTQFLRDDSQYTLGPQIAADQAPPAASADRQIAAN
jgi:hypothetical protein